MVPAKPIATWEFISMLQQCKPPAGWPAKLAIANSGGPDSICLVSLLNDTLRKGIGQDATRNEGWFRELISLNVDHQLQPRSPEMSLKSSNVSRNLCVSHETLRVPWGSPPYPPKPSVDRPFERIARDARYTLLLSGMRRHDAGAIAFGHHADDQLETFLMRLANGTGFLGLGGMKPVRRFGMGDGSPGEMGWYGVEGMQRWVVRPLLCVSKDRVLATCEERGLEYVTDETNFQPEVTLRNAIRHVLDGGKSADDLCHNHALQKAAVNAKRLGVPLTLSNGTEHLRSLANTYALKIQRIDAAARTVLRDCTVPSPPSTVLLSRDKLGQITDPAVRLSMVIQVLRFVSPNPWGSHTAEGSRRASGLDRIIAALFSGSCGDTPAQLVAFSAGSHVLWTPVYVRPDGELKYAKPTSGADGWTEGWLASRAPPRRTSNGPPRTDVDITTLAVGGTPSVDVLYDNRFVLTLGVDAIPERLLERLRSGDTLLMITATKRHSLPRLLLRSSNGDDVEEVDTPGPAPKAGSVIGAVPGGGGCPSGVGWARWRLVRAFE